MVPAHFLLSPQVISAWRGLAVEGGGGRRGWGGLLQPPGPVGAGEGLEGDPEGLGCPGCAGEGNCA